MNGVEGSNFCLTSDNVASFLIFDNFSAIYLRSPSKGASNEV